MGSNSSSIVISFSIAILLLLILLLLLSYNSKCKNDSVERFDVVSDGNNMIVSAADKLANGFNNGFDQIFNKDINSFTTMSGGQQGYTNDKKKETFANMEGSPVDSSYSLSSGANKVKQDTLNRDKLIASDLLPADATNQWAQVNPSSSGELSDKNFLTAGYHIGINTIGQSMRNANLQLRSEIPNPQVAVSPWLISTIEPDTRAVTFEIGSSPSS
jgi:hypothetical protein